MPGTFQKFAAEYQFEQFPQSNEKAENSVNTVKHILKKAALDASHDQHLSQK